MHTETISEIAAPIDATAMSAWSRRDDHNLAERGFTGAIRKAFGFAVRIEGIQRENGKCLRRVVAEADSLSTGLDPAAVRQLASALVAAGREIEARR